MSRIAGEKKSVFHHSFVFTLLLKGIDNLSPSRANLDSQVSAYVSAFRSEPSEMLLSRHERVPASVTSLEVYTYAEGIGKCPRRDPALEQQFQWRWAQQKRSHDVAALLFLLTVFAVREARRIIDPSCAGVRDSISQPTAPRAHLESLMRSENCIPS